MPAVLPHFPSLPFPESSRRFPEIHEQISGPTPDEFENDPRSHNG